MMIFPLLGAFAIIAFTIWLWKADKTGRLSKQFAVWIFIVLLVLSVVLMFGRGLAGFMGFRGYRDGLADGKNVGPGMMWWNQQDKDQTTTPAAK